MDRLAADDGAEQTDGRKARSEKTRALIAEAMMDLIAEGDLQPTSEAVAQRADVGHRTVFRHFQDMDALYREIDTRLHERVFSGVPLIEPTGPLKARVKQVVQMRSRIFEKMKMFRRATVLREWASPYLRATRTRNIRLLRERLHHALPELTTKADTVQHAVETLVSFETWEQLRVDQKCSIAKASDTITECVLQLMG